MPRIYWFDRARATFDELPPDAQLEIVDHLDRLRRFPELYQRVDEGRYRGYRRFLVLRRFHVYYRVVGDAQDCFVAAIRPARSRPE